MCWSSWMILWANFISPLLCFLVDRSLLEPLQAVVKLALIAMKQIESNVIFASLSRHFELGFRQRFTWYKRRPKLSNSRSHGPTGTFGLMFSWAVNIRRKSRSGTWALVLFGKVFFFFCLLPYPLATFFCSFFKFSKNSSVSPLSYLFRSRPF